MGNITKQALASAFEELLARKAYDKITVKDVAEAVQVNRQTFYYHFEDLHHLTSWIFETEAERILSGFRRQSWQQCLTEAFSSILRHRTLVLSVFHSPNRDELDQFLHRVSHPMFLALVTHSLRGSNISPNDSALIAWFYTYALTGMILDWIRHGMKDDPQELTVQIKQLIAYDLKAPLDFDL